jgi:Carboxylesterase type B
LFSPRRHATIQKKTNKGESYGTEAENENEKTFIVFALLFLLLFAALFELGKNTLWGWAALIALFVCAFVLHKKVFCKKRFLLRLPLFLLLLVCAGVLFRFSGPPAKQIPAVDVKNPEATGIVTVEQGDLTGVFNADKSVEVYAGIPFAAPPVGDLRWKEPQPPASWDGRARLRHVCAAFDAGGFLRGYGNAHAHGRLSYI